MTMKKIKSVITYFGNSPREIVVGQFFGTGMQVTEIIEGEDAFILRNETGSTLATLPKALTQATYEDEANG